MRIDPPCNEGEHTKIVQPAHKREEELRENIQWEDDVGNGQHRKDFVACSPERTAS